jgi:hypothetical protein
MLGTLDCCLEHVEQIRLTSASPCERTPVRWRTGGARCAGRSIGARGIDVGQALLLVVCVRVVDEDGKVLEQVRSFGATTPDLLDLRDWLTAAAVTHVAMESTGVYWKAPYYCWRTRSRCCWSTPHISSTSRAARPT